MHWLYLVVALVFLFIASRAATPTWLVVILVIGALITFVAWIVAWMSARVSGAARNEVQIISPDELRLLREQAEARKAAAAASANPDEPAG
jgi:Zn-dependent protease with chaperone function